MRVEWEEVALLMPDGTWVNAVSGYRMCQGRGWRRRAAAET